MDDTFSHTFAVTIVTIDEELYTPVVACADTSQTCEVVHDRPHRQVEEADGDVWFDLNRVDYFLVGWHTEALVPRSEGVLWVHQLQCVVVQMRRVQR